MPKREEQHAKIALGSLGATRPEWRNKTNFLSLDAEFTCATSVKSTSIRPIGSGVNF